jgi:uncharacterized protein with PhoU and TrkA domain
MFLILASYRCDSSCFSVCERKAQLVHQVDHVAQVVAALDLVLDLAEDLADLVFDGVGPAGALLEAGQVGEQLVVDEVAQVVAGHGGVVVELAVGRLGRRPASQR